MEEESHERRTTGHRRFVSIPLAIAMMVGGVAGITSVNTGQAEASGVTSSTMIPVPELHFHSNELLLKLFGLSEEGAEEVYETVTEGLKEGLDKEEIKETLEEELKVDVKFVDDPDDVDVRDGDVDIYIYAGDDEEVDEMLIEGWVIVKV